MFAIPSARPRLLSNHFATTVADARGPSIATPTASDTPNNKPSCHSSDENDSRSRLDEHRPAPISITPRIERRSSIGPTIGPAPVIRTVMMAIPALTSA